MPWTTGEIVGACVGGVIAVGVIIIIILALMGYFSPKPQQITKRDTLPPDDERDRQTGLFVSSYGLATGQYWVGNAANAYTCPGAPGSGGYNGYCAFGGTSARQNAETWCNNDDSCLGYANMTLNGQAYYVLGNKDPVNNMQHPPNLYYIKPGIEGPKLSVASSDQIIKNRYMKL
jgi:hypothetical protein